MSAFILGETGFIQLAAELAHRATDQNHRLHFDVCEFIGIEAYHPRSDCHAEASFTCQRLYAANVRAVNQRYDDAEDATELSFIQRLPDWSDLQLFKSLSCLRYQMAEGDVFESPIYNRLDRLVMKVAERVLSETPEYEEARWGWPTLKEEEPEPPIPPPPPGFSFALGKVVATHAALDTLREAGQHPSEFIRRHARLDRGVLSEADYQENLFSVDKRLRIFSAFETRKNEKLWVITEADRSATTILMPSEY